MLGQVYKDLKITKYSLVVTIFLLIILIYLFACIQGMKNYDTYEVLFLKGFIVLMLVILACCACSVIIGTIKKDENSNWITYSATLPGGIKNYVKGKYIVYLINSLYGILCSYVYIAVVNNIMDSKNIEISWKLPFIIFGILNCIVAIDLPFCFYYGVKKGSFVKCIFIYSIIFAAIIYGLFGNLDLVKNIDIEDKIIWASSHRRVINKCIGAGFIVSYLVVYLSYVIASKCLYKNENIL